MKKNETIPEFIEMMDNLMAGNMAGRTESPLVKTSPNGTSILLKYDKGLNNARIGVLMDANSGTTHVWVGKPNGFRIHVYVDEIKLPSKRAIESLISGQPLKRHHVVD